MAVKVRVPTQLRELSGGEGEISVDGSTVGEVLKALDAAHPGFAGRLFDDSGKLRRFVNVFVADEDVRFLEGLETPVSEGQTVSIVPAVAGGAGGPWLAPEVRQVRPLAGTALRAVGVFGSSAGTAMSVSEEP